MQTEATMLTNISQHCWMLHVTLNPAAFRHLDMFLRVVACRCLLLLRVPACCWELLLKVWNRLNFWSNDSHHFFSFFFFVHDCWSGVFLGVAETIADSLLCLRCGYCSASFQSFVLRLLYYHMGNFYYLIGLEQWYFSLIWKTYMWKLQTVWG